MADQFIQMTDSEAVYEEECQKLEARGKRLRRAALTTGILTVISILATIYTTIAVRWVLVEWAEPEKTAYEITENMAVYKIGVFLELVVCIVDVVIGITLGLIMVGAGVNPATAVTICTFKIVQQAISAANMIFLVGAGLLLDYNNPIYDVVQKYFYSDNMPPIGTQLSYLFLLVNQYGFYLQQVFGGMYMVMLGACICMWGVFPRYLGMSMWAAGIGYIVNSCLFLFFPGYDGVISWLLLFPALLTHFWLAGWLLVNTPHPSKNRNLFPSFTGRPAGDALMADKAEP
eukprot:CAMPEP_0116124366 /NCGR_PEP_ID=MMETSP0329-20121206/5243_1 /TAXON_ID=697910 /ORGANISM="Pseudo-nitzschia arenysensis, Strain B593" /LENGTH=287 /DNA_ID=CAMNT_0003618343 /DNA_START=106 /DNA_END=969 /DNA_ORIENTATION=+